jgi:hypothetical protein
VRWLGGEFTCGTKQVRGRRHKFIPERSAGYRFRSHAITSSNKHLHRESVIDRRGAIFHAELDYSERNLSFDQRNYRNAAGKRLGTRHSDRDNNLYANRDGAWWDDHRYDDSHCQCGSATNHRFVHSQPVNDHRGRILRTDLGDDQRNLSFDRWSCRYATSQWLGVSQSDCYDDLCTHRNGIWWDGHCYDDGSGESRGTNLPAH